MVFESFYWPDTCRFLNFCVHNATNKSTFQIKSLNERPGYYKYYILALKLLSNLVIENY